MMHSSEFTGLKQAQIDWLLKSGVTIEAMIRPEPIRLAHGRKAHDGIFEADSGGSPWLAFDEGDDVVFWQPRTGDLATDCNRAFALGQDVIDNPATYSFDCNLNVFANPLDWLQAKRDGIVILDWSRAWSRLQDCPRIAIADELLFQFRRHFEPPHKPEIFVLTGRKAVAA
ncbi:hypothetical protein [Aquibium oceanicum]|nr:hypothetical protein [Aquibium oceanicum]